MHTPLASLQEALQVRHDFQEVNTLGVFCQLCASFGSKILDMIIIPSILTFISIILRRPPLHLVSDQLVGSIQGVSTYWP